MAGFRQRRARPHEKHLARGVIEDEAGAVSEAGRSHARLAVAGDDEQVDIRAGLDDGVLDVSSPGDRARGPAQAGQRGTEERLSLLVGHGRG